MPRAICVMTARGVDTTLAEGGSQAWVLDAKRARKYNYVVCVQNRNMAGDWGHATAPHHMAFLVGRLKDVVRSKEDGSENRWMLLFSEYAEIDVGNAWGKYRNPIRYIDLGELGIDVDTLQFQPMPERPPVPAPDKKSQGLTIAEAKEGLALTFGILPSDIEITIRG